MLLAAESQNKLQLKSKTIPPVGETITAFPLVVPALESSFGFARSLSAAPGKPCILRVSTFLQPAPFERRKIKKSVNLTRDLGTPSNWQTLPPASIISRRVLESPVGALAAGAIIDLSSPNEAAFRLIFFVEEFGGHFVPVDSRGAFPLTNRSRAFETFN